MAKDHWGLKKRFQNLQKGFSNRFDAAALHGHATGDLSLTLISQAFFNIKQKRSASWWVLTRHPRLDIFVCIKRTPPPPVKLPQPIRPCDPQRVDNDLADQRLPIRPTAPLHQFTSGAFFRDSALTGERFEAGL